MKNTTGNHPQSLKPDRSKRPFVLWVILLVFMLWLALGWSRFSQTLVKRELILEQLETWRFWYILFAGLAWGLLAIPALWGILWRRCWAKTGTMIIGILYPGIYWVERLLLWAPDETQGNWPFMLSLTLVWIGILIWMGFSKKVRRYFGL
jgi:hypothetical protein